MEFNLSNGETCCEGGRQQQVARRLQNVLQFALCQGWSLVSKQCDLWQLWQGDLLINLSAVQLSSCSILRAISARRC